MAQENILEAFPRWKICDKILSSHYTFYFSPFSQRPVAMHSSCVDVHVDLPGGVVYKILHKNTLIQTRAGLVSSGSTQHPNGKGEKTRKNERENVRALLLKPFS